MTERLLQFTPVNYAANSNGQLQFKAAAFNELNVRVVGNLSAAVATTLADEVPWPLVGPIALEIGGQQRFRAEAISLFHLSAFYNGGYPHRVHPAAAGTGGFYSAFNLPFGKMMDGAGLDATGLDAFLRMTWRPAAYLGTGGSPVVDATTQLQAWVSTVFQKPAAGFLEPEWQQATHRVDSSSTSLAHTIDFKKAVLLPGLLLEALDASGGAGTDASAGVDGLVKKVSVELNRPGRPAETLVKDMPWGQLRFQTVRRGGYSLDDETASVGVVFLPLFERRGGRRRDALFLDAGSSLTITYDTASTVEAGYTNVAAAAGDVVRVLSPGFLPVGDESVAASASLLDRDRLSLAQRALRAGQSTSRARAFLR